MKKVSSNGLPQDVYAKRNELIMELSVKGFATITILAKVNNSAEEKGWQRISLRTVQKVIADYYRSNSPDPTEAEEEDKGMRAALFMQLQLEIEQLSKYIEIRESGEMPWQPFEFPKIMKLLNKMQVDYAEMNGWNHMKHPPAKISDELKRKLLQSEDINKPPLPKAVEEFSKNLEAAHEAALEAEEQRRVENTPKFE